MLHNYHTHTFRNHHTVGTEREYIESAIKNGFQNARLFRACAIPVPGWPCLLFSYVP